MTTRESARSAEHLRRTNRTRRKAYFDAIRSRRERDDARYAFSRSIDEVVRASSRVASLRQSKSPAHVNLSGLSPDERFVLIAEEVHSSLREARGRRDTTPKSRIAEFLAGRRLAGNSGDAATLSADRISDLLKEASGRTRDARHVVQSQNLAELRVRLKKFVAGPGVEAAWEGPVPAAPGNEDLRWSPLQALRTGVDWMDIEAHQGVGSTSDDIWVSVQYAVLTASVASLIALTSGTALPFLVGASVAAEFGSAAGSIALAVRVASIAVDAKGVFQTLENLRQYEMTGNATDADVFGPEWNWVDTAGSVLAATQFLKPGVMRKLSPYLPGDLSAVGLRISEIGSGSPWFDAAARRGRLARVHNIKWMRPRIAPKIATVDRVIRRQKLASQISTGVTVFRGLALALGKNSLERSTAENKQIRESVNAAIGMLDPEWKPPRLDEFLESSEFFRDLWDVRND